VTRESQEEEGNDKALQIIIESERDTNGQEVRYEGDGSNEVH